MDNREARPVIRRAFFTRYRTTGVPAMRHPLLLLLVCVLAAAGCVTDTNLVPAPGANLLPGPEAAAMAEQDGVRVEASPDVWSGEAPISREVTPVRITIDNDGDAPIRIRYADFALQAPGRVYPALPPFEIEGSVAAPIGRAPYGPVADPGFGATGFGVAPAYSPIYPGYPVVADDFFAYDPLWYDDWYARWRRYELPTAEMVGLAVPEGTLAPGGQLTGFLYFDDIPADVPRTRFTMEVVNARTGEQLDTIEIPFLVVES
jgi:hypothetical protein